MLYSPNEQDLALSGPDILNSVVAGVNWLAFHGSSVVSCLLLSPICLLCCHVAGLDIESCTGTLGMQLIMAGGTGGAFVSMALGSQASPSLTPKHMQASYRSDCLGDVSNRNVAKHFGFSETNAVSTSKCKPEW